MSIADASFVIALGNKNDHQHNACLSVYQAETIIYLPQSVMAEVGYMLTRELGKKALARFLRQLPDMKYRIIPLEMEDFLRTANILDQYADTRIDFVDATVIAAAERMDISRILTLDQRDFQIARPRHTAYFELLPAP